MIIFDCFSHHHQTEESLNELQRSISPTYTNKIMTILQNHNDIIVEKSNDDSSEL